MKEWSLIVADDEEEVARLAAGFIKDRLAARPNGALAFPTGQTPLRMYDQLVRLHESDDVDFSRTTVFNLDEFYSLPPAHSASFAYYLRTHLLDRVAVGGAVLFDGIASDIDEECSRVEKDIESAGGLDLVVLGIGQNGHIAFNEPGSPRESRTRLVALTDSTRWANRAAFLSMDDVPYTALTLGLSTILEARHILLLAAGPGKANILACSLNGPVTEDVPASHLQAHPNLTVIADRSAAAWVRRD